MQILGDFEFMHASRNTWSLFAGSALQLLPLSGMLRDSWKPILNKSSDTPLWIWTLLIGKAKNLCYGVSGSDNNLLSRKRGCDLWFLTLKYQVDIIILNSFTPSCFYYFFYKTNDNITIILDYWKASVGLCTANAYCMWDKNRLNLFLTELTGLLL